MSENYLEHHGILGQRWGIRRYQNPDGSLTEAGRKRYMTDALYGSDRKKAKALRKLSDADVAAVINRSAAEKRYLAESKEKKDLEPKKIKYTKDMKDALYGHGSKKKKAMAKLTDEQMQEVVNRKKLEDQMGSKKDGDGKDSKKNKSMLGSMTSDAVKEAGKDFMKTVLTGALVYGGTAMVTGKFDWKDLANAAFNSKGSTNEKKSESKSTTSEKKVNTEYSEDYSKMNDRYKQSSGSKESTASGNSNESTTRSYSNTSSANTYAVYAAKTMQYGANYAKNLLTDSSMMDAFYDSKTGKWR